MTTKDAALFEHQNPTDDDRAEGRHVEVKLAGVDLNLLVALEGLLAHRNVTHAARRIGQTQPAMSRALARLRDVLDDDILVRGSGGLQLTARGNYLAQRLPAAMAQLREVIFARQPDHEIRLTINEYLSPVLLPRLMRDMPAGNTPLRGGTHRTTRAALDQLENRSADFVLGAAIMQRDGLATRPVLVEDFVTLATPDLFDRLSGGNDLGAFMDTTHAVIVQQEEDAFPQLRSALTQAELPQAQMLVVPDLTAAALVASQGHMALTVPRSIAVWLQRIVSLNSFAPPVAVAHHQIVIGWLERELDRGEAMLLDKICTSARAALSTQAVAS